MPLLYRSVFIDVDQWSDEHLDKIFMRRHPGHLHIRTVDIDSTHLRSEEKALKVAKDALEVLPRDRLTSYRCPMETGLDDDLMVLLTANQRCLKFLSIGPFRPNTFMNPPLNHDLWPNGLETVVVPWQLFSARDVQFYQDMIKDCSSSLRALTVRSSSFRASGISHSFYPNSASGRLVRDLFKHTLSETDSPKQYLHDLNLQDQALAEAKDTWLQVVDMSRLSTLQLWNCLDTEVLLSCLVELAREERPRLHGLVVSSEHVPPTNVQWYLKSTTDLRYLNLFYIPDGNVPPFDIRCLEGHSHSIKDLMLGIGSNYEENNPVYVPSIRDFTWLTRSFKQLRQLAIGMPELLIRDAVAGRWCDYGSVMTMLATLPQLKVLRILTLPRPSSRRYSGNLLETPLRRGTRHLLTNLWKQDEQLYMTGLDIVANSIVRLFQRTRGEALQRLSVLIFGHAECPQCAVHTNGRCLQFEGAPITYKVKTKMSEFGLRLKVKRIEARELEHVEPIAYVVDEDTDQGLSLEAYSWGSSYP